MAKRMYVFDVDGVITNPANNQVSREVLRHIAADLGRGDAVAFNTGRPYVWVEASVIPALRGMCTPDALNHLLVVTEMGGEVAEFSGGKVRIAADTGLSLPPEFIADVKTAVERTEANGMRLGDYVWWDDAKRTMGSLVKRDDVSVDELNRVRPLLAKQLETLLKTHKLGEFELGQTTIATDIQHRTAGKHKGAEQVLAWLGRRREQPEHYYAFGDSESDKHMAESLAATGVPTTFVFVGATGSAAAVQSTAYDTVIMSGRHSEDTAEFLAEVG